MLNSMVCICIHWIWYGWISHGCACKQWGGCGGFCVKVILSSRQLFRNDVVSGLKFQCLPFYWFTFSFYFGIDT